MTVRGPPVPGPWGPQVPVGLSRPPRRPRPYGVAVLAVVAGLVGLTGVVVGILALLEPFAALGPAATLVGVVGEYLLPLTTLVAAALALVGILLFSVAQGLWRLERWALAFSIGLLFVAEAVLFFYLVPFSDLFFGLLVVFVYLLAVRGHFT